jgi:large subunit ribosomal protein L6
MSRIGKNPLIVAKEVKVSIGSSNVHMEGPKGKIDWRLPSGIKVEQKDDQLVVSRVNDTKQSRSNHGTVRATLENMVKGVLKGHRKDLEIQGIGFRATIQGKKVIFNVGLSHPVEFDVPEDVKVGIDNQTLISVEGPDLIRVGLIASQIKDIKPVEPYKGKGIRYSGQKVLRKQGKAVTK